MFERNGNETRLVNIVDGFEMNYLVRVIVSFNYGATDISNLHINDVLVLPYQMVHRCASVRKYCDLTISQNQDLRPVHSLLRQKLEYFHQNTLYVYGRRLYSLLTSDILKHFYKCFYPCSHRTA